MSVQAPRYLDSPFYDDRTDTLREGAPKELIDEYNEYKNGCGCCLEGPTPETMVLTEEDIGEA